MPDTMERPQQRDYALEEEERKLQEQLRELHRKKQQREAGEFYDALGQEANSEVANRLVEQNKRFSPEIPGVTVPGDSLEKPAEAVEQSAERPIAELNASLARGKENLAEEIVSGKRDATPDDMVNSVEALMSQSE